MSLTATQVAQARLAVQGSMGTVVGVEPYSGSGAYGDIYLSSRNWTCSVDWTRRKVRNANGEEVVSEFVIEAPYGAEADFPPGSKVTIAGRISFVITVGPPAFAGQVVYVKVACA